MNILVVHAMIILLTYGQPRGQQLIVLINYHFVANFLLSLAVKEFWIFRKVIDMSRVLFFDSQCILPKLVNQLALNTHWCKGSSIKSHILYIFNDIFVNRVTAPSHEIECKQIPWVNKVKYLKKRFVFLSNIFLAILVLWICQKCVSSSSSSSS